MSAELTDQQVLELCARAVELEVVESLRTGRFRVRDRGVQFYWNPLTDGGDGAAMENKCGVVVDCWGGESFERTATYSENFTPGNDLSRRRASCLVVARAQLAKEKEA